jgi:phosphate-selective porin OprO/OprP
MARGLLCLAFVAAALGASAPVAESSDRVAKALLDALKANGTIDEKQYGELNQLIEDEAAAEHAAAPSVAAPPPERPGRLEVFWTDGIRMESADGAFKLRLGGRLQNDWGVVSPDSDLREALPDDAGKGSGTDWRRVRLQLGGTIYERIGTKIELDFAGGNANLRDAYIELVKLPWVGTFRVGHFKEPISLEEMTSDSFTTFVERSLMDAFAPSRNTGFLLTNAPLEQRMTWSLGAFRETNNATGDGFGEDALYNVTGRVTGLPWYEDGGKHLLHVGIAASQKFLNDTSIAFASVPEVELANPDYVDTGDVPANTAQLLNPELTLVWGPFSFQSEYTHAWVQGSADQPNADFYGLYAQASWFVTGESRPYSTSIGAFERVTPERNFDLHGGPGAWELALRYSRIDLDDGDVQGGVLNDGTVGMNWYLNPNVKTSVNYVFGKLEDVGWVNQFVTRFQLDF